MLTVGQPLRLPFWQAKRLPYNFFSNYFVRNPVNRLVADAALSFSASPISSASRPTSIAFLNAFANCARSGLQLGQERGSNALRPSPDQRRSKIEEIGVHRAIWTVKADCHRENSRSDQHVVFGTELGTSRRRMSRSITSVMPIAVKARRIMLVPYTHIAGARL